MFSCPSPEEAILVKFQLHYSVKKKELELKTIGVKPLRPHDLVSIPDCGLHSANDINDMSMTLAKSLNLAFFSYNQWRLPPHRVEYHKN